MAYLKTTITTHRQKVCSLYKRALRCTEDWSNNRIQYRFEACLLRKRFDENRHETDIRKAKQLVEAGEEELFQNQHPQPFQFPDSPGGVAYGREVPSPDWVLDYWHPLEKAQYPKYFALREKRKKEYLEKWERQYGKPQIEEH